MFCTKSDSTTRDATDGDSGGPFVMQGNVVVYACNSYGCCCVLLLVLQLLLMVVVVAVVAVIVVVVVVAAVVCVCVVRGGGEGWGVTIEFQLSINLTGKKY